jgi:hypothetical protein
VISEGWAGRTDAEVIAAAGANGWYFVTADNKILQRPQERAAIIRYSVGAFFFTGRTVRNRFQWLRLIVDRFEDMQRFAEANAIPFCAQVPDRGTIKLIKNKATRRS